MKRLYRGVLLSTLITFKLFSQLTTDGHDDERGTANGRGQQSRRVEVGTRRPWQMCKDERRTPKRRCCRDGSQSFDTGACVNSLQDHYRRLHTEPEVLAMLHVEHPAVKIKIKNTRTRSSILITRDEMTINLLESLDNIRGKKVSFNRMEPAGESRTYVLMGVPLCVPEELLQADPAVISATRMPRWCKQSKSAQPTEMVKVQLAGKEHHPRFTRGYGSYKMKTFNAGLCNVSTSRSTGIWPFHAFEIPTCRYCEGPHTSKDCKGKTDITLK